MRKKNCWEEKKCGRFPGGWGTAEHGPCPATTCVVATGINGGIYAGRSCWAIDNTLCEGKIPVSFAEKFGCCLDCAFYLRVLAEEGRNYQGVEEIRKELAGYQVY